MRRDDIMGHFYFVRHGQTVWNVENKICGATDSPLTEHGRQQAAETGKNIVESGIKADEILYSPLSRAADTAKIISEMSGIPCREEPRLIEQNFGKWESTPRDGKEFKMAKASFACRYEGGESMLQLAQRIYNLLDEIKQWKIGSEDWRNREKWEQYDEAFDDMLKNWVRSKNPDMHFIPTDTLYVTIDKEAVKKSGAVNRIPDLFRIRDVSLNASNGEFAV